MRAVVALLAEARARGMLPGLVADAFAMAFFFAVLAFVWIATPEPSSEAFSPRPASAYSLPASEAGGSTSRVVP